MDLGWFESLLFGLVSGISEFLPISSVAHQALFLELVGGTASALLRLTVHGGMLLALVIGCLPVLTRLSREQKIAAIPKKRRRRQPDFRSLMDVRIWRIAGIPLVLSFVAYPFVNDLYDRLWILAILLGINGVFLYAPQFLPSANKDSQSLSAWDAMLIGLGAASGVFPGVSRLGASTSVSLMRGTQRQYGLELGLLLSIPALIVLMVIDFIGLFGALGAVTFGVFVKSLLAGASAFGSAYFGIFMMRFLSVRTGFAGFAYYSWGLALFSFILYLAV